MPGERTLSPAPPKAPQELRARIGELRTISDLVREGKIQGNVVLLRADLDIPVGNGSEDPTQSLRLHNAADMASDLAWKYGASKVVIMGHMGRPEKERISTQTLVQPLSQMLEEGVEYLPDVVDKAQIESSGSRFLILENTRFFEGEQSKDPETKRQFAQRLAAMGDAFVGDAFAVSHRGDASVARVPEFLPSAAGSHLESEVSGLSKIEQPRTPSIAIMGGAKVDDKLPVIERMASVMDQVLVGGKMAGEIRQRGIELPENVIVADLSDDGFDISPDSAEEFARRIAVAQTIVWNGPMGWFEEGHDAGTQAVARAIDQNEKAYSLAGGGDTVAFLTGHREQYSHFMVSSGGGAMLEMLAGKPMPGVESLRVN